MLESEAPTLVESLQQEIDGWVLDSWKTWNNILVRSITEKFEKLVILHLNFKTETLPYNMVPCALQLGQFDTVRQWELWQISHTMVHMYYCCSLDLVVIAEVNPVNSKDNSTFENYEVWNFILKTIYRCIQLAKQLDSLNTYM